MPQEVDAALTSARGVSSPTGKQEGRPRRSGGVARSLLSRQGRIGVEDADRRVEERGRGRRGALCMAALVAVVSAGRLRRRLGRRLHRARDLRRRRQHHPRRGRQDRRRQGRARSARSRPRRTPKAAVVLNIENPGFQDFRADASCTIEPAGADRREVRRLPAHPAARRKARRCRRRCPRSPAATKAQGSTCCRSRTPPARSTSICSATSTGCPSASA